MEASAAWRCSKHEHGGTTLRCQAAEGARHQLVEADGLVEAPRRGAVTHCLRARVGNLRHLSKGGEEGQEVGRQVRQGQAVVRSGFGRSRFGPPGSDPARAAWTRRNVEEDEIPVEERSSEPSWRWRKKSWISSQNAW